MSYSPSGRSNPGDPLDLVGTRTRGHRPHAGLDLDVLTPSARVVLVLDVADQFLDDVFERHHSGGPAVLVDDDGHLGGVRSKFGEHDTQPGRFGHGQDLAHQRRHRRGLVLRTGNAEEVLRVNDAVDPVVVVDHRESRMRRRHEVAQIGGGRIGVDGDDTVPRHHRVGCFEFTEIDGALEQLRLQQRQVATLGGRIDDQIEFLGRHCTVEFLDRLDPDEAEQLVRGTVEEANHRPGNPHEDPRRWSQRTSDGFGSGDGEVLRRQFAEHHLRHRDEDEGQHEGDSERCRIGDAGRLENGGEHRCDGRFGDEAEGQRRDRDAELRSRQHEAESLVDVDRPLRAAITLVGLLQEPTPARRHERELHGDEVAVRGDQGDDTDQPESSQHGVNFVFGRRTWVARCYPHHSAAVVTGLACPPWQPSTSSR